VAKSVFTLAHLSDWHTTTLEGATLSELATKRFWGWQSWKRSRRKRHLTSVLEKVIADLQAQSPDHVIVTGDLTNIALEQEFIEAASLLKGLGPPDWVSVVPGNHDAYVRVPSDRGWDRWAPYLWGDEGARADRAPRPEEYPTLRVREGIALIGCCSAQPTPVFQASGVVGPEQLERLAVLLKEQAEAGHFRVVALHHPPNTEDISARRSLRDFSELQAVLKANGAELVVHGHRHHSYLGEVPGPTRPIPVAGVRSASDVGKKEERRAQYHLYRIEVDEAGATQLSLRVRGYDPETDAMRDEGERAIP